MLRLIKFLLLNTLILCSTLATAHNSDATSSRLSYSSLYSQLKYNLKPEYHDIEVALFFVDAQSGQVCTIHKAWMEKEKKYQAFTIPNNNQLPLPLDSNLRSANPLVYVDLPDDKQCDYRFIVMTKEPLTGQVSYTQVEKLTEQMQFMFEDLGGMLARWFSPTVSGITLKFASIKQGTITTKQGKHFDIQNGTAQIDLTRLQSDDVINLPTQTAQVLPFIKK